MAAAVVVAHRPAVTTGAAAQPPHAGAFAGLPFWKMSGSGNDFVFFDGRGGLPPGLDSPATIAALCSRTAGVGADGVVFVEPDGEQAFRIRYFNRDGSRGELCGNASLCTTNLGVRLGLGRPEGFAFGTDVGPVRARLVDGTPEIDLQPWHDLRADSGIVLEPGEERIGYVNTGVPHLVVLVGDADAVDLPTRGARLRRHPRTMPAGANVNFVSRAASGKWRMRTFERGVEGETMACGTGAVATAVLLSTWGLASGAETAIQTSSGRLLTASGATPDGRPRAALRGEGRLVFSGQLGDV